MGLRFHWRLPLAGEEPGSGVVPPPGTPASALPDLPSHVRFCRLAEEHGIDSLLMACGYYMPDPVPLVAALGTATERVRFMLAYRSGLLSPTVFVQQVNTLSVLNGGRVSLNMVIGHSVDEQRCYGDFLTHDERYHRSDEFLTICKAFWKQNGAVDFAGRYFHIEQGRLGTPFLAPDRAAPEIYLGGGSPLAREIAARHADCWLRLGDAPEKIRADVEGMREHGVEVGIRLSLVARPTREEAVAAAYALTGQGDREWVRQVFVKSSDSASMQETFHQAGEESQWPTPWLWTGAVASRGASAVCLVGTPGEIAGAILDYARLGVGQFIFSGWPNADALACFGAEILPRVRAGEAALAG
ncbi:MAG TPA: LLM class flavin-dependent oxidoreductase [Thermoanaerobaculia bacterium]|nr:LLM class flavin-dependent oxidoreductase [Thermoanaerobaculia bacterium]